MLNNPRNTWTVLLFFLGILSIAFDESVRYWAYQVNLKYVSSEAYNPLIPFTIKAIPLVALFTIIWTKNLNRLSYAVLMKLLPACGFFSLYLALLCRNYQSYLNLNMVERFLHYGFGMLISLYTVWHVSWAIKCPQPNHARTKPRS